MGQYFKAVNKTKKELVCPWCMGGGAKLWEWAANPQGAIFTLLLRKSDATGGGDFRRPQLEAINGDEESGIAATITQRIMNEGARYQAHGDWIVGRWAGDEVYLVGDYDSSNLYHDASDFRNVTPELIEVWNQFIELDHRKLTYERCSTCGE